MNSSRIESIFKGFAILVMAACIVAYLVTVDGWMLEPLLTNVHGETVPKGEQEYWAYTGMFCFFPAFCIVITLITHPVKNWKW